MSTAPPEDHDRGPWHVVEVNPFAPRPWVFTDLAASLHAALQRCGWAGGCFVEALPPDGVCVVVGWTPQWLARHAAALQPRRTVLFNTTPVSLALGERAGAEQAAWLAEFGHWVVADLHPENIERLQALEAAPGGGHWHGGTSGAALRAVFLPLPPALPPYPGPGVADPVAPAPDLDVLLVGTPSPRREAALRAIAAAGLRVGQVAGAYGAELTPWLRRARLLLHVHHGADRLLPWARLLQPLALGLPVVCEACEGPSAQLWHGSGVVFAPEESLPECCLRVLADDAGRAERAQAGRRFAAGLGTEATAALRRLRARLEAMPEQRPLDTEIDRALGLPADGALPPPAGERPAPVMLSQRTPTPNWQGRVVVVVQVLVTLLLLWWFAIRR